MFVVNNLTLELALWIAALGAATQLAAVARLFLRVKTIAPECRACGYSMQGLPPDQNACPECGRILTPADRRPRLGWQRRNGPPTPFHPKVLWLTGCVCFFVAFALLDPVARVGYVTQTFIIPILVDGQVKANATLTCQAPVQLLRIASTHDFVNQGVFDLTRVTVRFNKQDFASEAKVARLYIMDLQDVRAVSGIASPATQPFVDPASLVRAMFEDAGLHADAGEEQAVVELLQEIRGETLFAHTADHIPQVPFSQPRQVVRNHTLNVVDSMLTPSLRWAPYLLLFLWLVAGWGLITLRIKRLLPDPAR